jgi:hypothetical protein
LMKSSKLAGSCGLAPCTATLRLKPKSRPLLDCLHNWRRTTVLRADTGNSRKHLTAPAQPLASPDPKPHSAIQAEIDRLKAEIARLADRQFDLALQESSSAPQAPERVRRKQRTGKKVGARPFTARYLTPPIRCESHHVPGWPVSIASASNELQFVQGGGARTR